MPSDGSITQWIHALRAGDPQAARRLWERFFQRMKDLARPESRPQVTGGTYDEEDVALSAFANFCRGLREGSYPDLDSRDGLWSLLGTITLHKARDRARQARALKRGGGAVVHSLSAQGPEEEVDPLEDVAERTPPPDLMALMTEQCQVLVGLLDDPELEALVWLKLEGHTNEEIAERLGYTRRTIQRMLQVVRRLWESDRS
jgi:DNA-directed RNA polymerase specialized sigma24 family protein